MTRCALRAATAAALGACLLAAALPSAAQFQRPFPPTALRGELRIEQPPEVLLNGRPARLAPGARIRGEDNLLRLSGSLVGQPLLVHYTIDPYGLVLDVWVLTAEERKRVPWPTTPAEAAAWRFDAAAQAWSRP
jgi:hypothetical protein